MTLVHDAIANLQQLSELFLKRREQLARSVGLTVQEWKVIEEINGEHFMPSLFAEERESSRAAVSKILRQLMDKGLISVTISPENGRRRDYTLTAEGEKVIKHLREARADAIAAIWSQFPEEDLTRFINFTRTLTGKLEAYSNHQE
ncbi:MAG: MarR family transcriptional regulator [Candidatus Sumerlaeia bacterium]|nr:MarR family transcriptional regulator [Candidatus Sumerlaeia bacterium]